MPDAPFDPDAFIRQYSKPAGRKDDPFDPEKFIKQDAPPPSETWPQYAGGLAKSAAVGAAKTVTGLVFPDPSKLGEAPGPIAKWAGSTDPDHPIAEEVGKLAPTLALGPEWGVGKGAASLVAKYGPAMAQDILRTIARGAGSAAESTAKGAIGGASQSPTDPNEGLLVGGGAGLASKAARAGFGRLPRATQRGIQFGVGAAPVVAGVEAGREALGGHKSVPWPVWHSLVYGLAPPLATIAAMVMRQPGLAGALTEQMTKGFGDGEQQ